MVDYVKLAEEKAKQPVTIRTSEGSASRLEKLKNDAKYFVGKYGKAEYNRALNYYTTKSYTEQYGIDTKTIAPTFSQYDDLVTNKDQYKQKYGDKEYKRIRDYYAGLSKDDISKINKAVSYKTDAKNFGSDLFEYSPKLAERYKYDDADAEDQLRKAIGLMPKSFTTNEAKAIIKAAKEIEKSQMSADETVDNYAREKGLNSAGWDSLDVSDSAITKENLIKAIYILNTASGQKSARQLADNAVDLQNMMQGDIQKIQSAVDTAQNREAIKDSMREYKASNISTTKTPMDEKKLTADVEKQQAFATKIAERESQRNAFKANVAEISGKDYDNAMSELNLAKKRIELGYIKELPDNLKELDKYVSDAPIEAYIPTREESNAALENPLSAGAFGFVEGVTFGLGSQAAEALGLGEGIVLTEDQYYDLLKNPPKAEVSGKSVKQEAKYGLIDTPGFVFPFLNENGETAYYVPGNKDALAQAQANNPLAFGIGYALGNIPVTIATGGASAEAAGALGASPALARAIGGAVPGAIRGFSSGLQSGDIGNIAVNTLGGAAIGGIGAGLVSPALEGTVGKALQNAPPIIQNVAANAAGSLGYSTLDILGRAGIGTLTGNKINWTQELASIPSDLLLDIVLGGKVNVPNTRAKNIIDANIKNGTLDIDGVKAEYEQSAKPYNSASTKTDTDINSTAKTRKAAESVANQFSNTAEGQGVKSDIEQGKYQYTPESSAKDLNDARNIIRQDTQKAISNADDVVNLNGEAKRYNKKDVALVEALLESAVQGGNQTDVDKYTGILADMGTELGQSVQMFANISRLTPEGFQVYIKRKLDRLNADGRAKFSDNWTDVSFTDAEQKTILDAKTPDDRDLALLDALDRIQNELPSTKWEKFDQYRKTMMLGNLKTIVARNMGGNFLMKGAVAIKNKIRAGIESVFLPKEKRTTSLFLKQEYKDIAKGSWEKGAKQAYENAGKWELDRTKLSAKPKHAFNDSGLGKVLNKFTDITGAVMEWGDLIFSKPAYETALARFMQTRGLKEVTQEAAEFALKEALEATYRGASKFVSAITTFQRKAGGWGKALSVIQPFVKTTSNITKAAFEYSQTGLLKTLLWDSIQLKRGKITGDQFINNISKGLTGAVVLSGLGYLINSGVIPGIEITGDWSEKTKEREIQKLQGFQPYSLKIGDVYISIAWAQPIATSILTGAMMAREVGKDGGNIFNALNPLKQADILLDGLGELTLYKPVADAIKYSEGLSDAAQNVAANLVEQSIPSLGRQIANTTASSKYETSSSDILERLKNRVITSIPGANDALKALGIDTDIAKSIDVWGNEKKQSDSVIERAVLNFFSPANVTTAQSDPVTDEIARLYNATDNTNVLPRVFKDRVISIAEESTSLTQKDVEALKKEAGAASYRLVNIYMNSQVYAQHSDETRVNEIYKIYKTVWDAYKKQFITQKTNIPAMPKIK